MDAKRTRSDEPHAGPGSHERSTTCGPIDIRIAADEAAIRQILELRTAIYRRVGKWRHATPMMDRFDYESGAVHIGAWSNESLVGAARVLVRPPDEEYEHDRFLAWDDVGLPPRGACVEVSRLCVRRHPHHPGTLRCLLREIAWQALISGRRYLVACATPDLLPVYLRMFGATSTGYTFVHSDLGPKSHTMLHADVPGGITGRTTAWPVWAALWAPVALRAYRANLLRPDEGPMRRAVALAHAHLACALPLGRLRWRA
jgi:hypothetical protein